LFLLLLQQLAHRALAPACKVVALEQQQQLGMTTHTGSGAARLAGSAAAEQQQWLRQQLVPVVMTAAAASMHCLVLEARLLRASALLSGLVQQQ
jgi:hypothetical protein